MNRTSITYIDIDFVIVGPSKTATTWLSQCLREHSEIFATNETNYLTHYKHLGPEYLDRHFANRGDKEILGEYANWYCSFRRIPGELAEYNPELKIIFCIRDPLKRAVSFFKHDVQWNVLGSQIKMANVLNEDMFYYRYIHPGRYSVHVREYLKYFPPERIYLFPTPVNDKDAKKQLSGIFKFLGVTPEEVPSACKRLNESRTPLFPSLYRAENMSKNRIFKRILLPLNMINQRLGGNKFRHIVSEEDYETIRKALMDINEKEQLKELVENEKLCGSAGIEAWTI